MAYSFTKDWTNPSDFPTVETNEAQVREDMQELPNQLLAMVNEISASGAVTTAKIANKAVTTAKLADGAVTLGKLDAAVLGRFPLPVSMKTVTISASSWTKRMVGAGALEYFHEATVTYVGNIANAPPPYSEGVTVIRPHFKVYDQDPWTTIPQPEDYSSQFSNLRNCKDVDFVLASLEPGPVSTVVARIYAYGWGNDSGRTVTLDILSIPPAQ